MISICIPCYYLGQKEVAHWVLSVALILSLILGFYLYCGACLMFHIWAMLGMVSENVVRKYKMTFVVKVCRNKIISEICRKKKMKTLDLEM
jgi:cytochrome b subunit of formate dehydrogenase